MLQNVTQGIGQILWNYLGNKKWVSHLKVRMSWVCVREVVWKQSRQLAKCKLDLKRVWEVRWDQGSTEAANRYTFFCGNRNAYHHLGTGFSVHKGTISTFKRVDYDGSRISHLTIRGHWCDRSAVVFNILLWKCMLQLWINVVTQSRSWQCIAVGHMQPIRPFSVACWVCWW